MYSNWYAVQVRSGKEDKFVEWCEKKVNHQAYKDIFIPRVMMAKKYQGKWHNEKRVLFPGYVFVITDQVEDLFQELKKIPDLTKMLGEYKGEIFPIYSKEVQYLLKYDQEGHVVNMSTGYIEGDNIIITDGPLMGYEGSIKKIDRHKRIAYLDLEGFEDITSIKVGLEIISKN